MANVFGESLADFPREVKAVESGVFLFERLDDSEAMNVVVETTV